MPHCGKSIKVLIGLHLLCSLVSSFVVRVGLLCQILKITPVIALSGLAKTLSSNRYMYSERTNNKSADQTACLCSLVSIFVVYVGLITQSNFVNSAGNNIVWIARLCSLVSSVVVPVGLHSQILNNNGGSNIVLIDKTLSSNMLMLKKERHHELCIIQWWNGLFNWHSNSRLTYRPTRPTRPTLYGPSIGLFEMIFFSSKQCPHTCNMTMNCLLGGHVIPLDWASRSWSISNWPPWGIWAGGTWLVSLTNCHITQIRTPADDL